MEHQKFQLGAYLTNGVEKIVKGAIRATLTDPRESAFMARFWAKKKPMVGMLMMPKTMAYIWMICLGLEVL